MTPLINRLLRAEAAGVFKNWCAEDTGMPDAKTLLEAIADATVFQVDEADRETTLIRERHPNYFATASGLFLPADLCWYEFKTIDAGGTHFGRAAFLAADLGGEGIRVFHISHGRVDAKFQNVATGGREVLTVIPMFDLPADLIGRDDQIEGRLLSIDVHQTALDLMPEERISTTANFFMELVKMVNLPHSLKIADVSPHKGMERRLKAALGPGATFQPYRTISLDAAALAVADIVEAAGGRRAHHFCRAHLRFKLGKTEHVRAHWRGDEALGTIPRRPYRVGPSSAGEGPGVA